MKLVIAAGHAGFPLKEEVRGYVERFGREALDGSAFNIQPLDYADFPGGFGTSPKASRTERECSFAAAEAVFLEAKKFNPRKIASCGESTGQKAIDIRRMPDAATYPDL
jgi:hypothetical protein